MDECQICSGPLVSLDTLGNIAYYRCRNCGAVQSSVDPDAPTWGETKRQPKAKRPKRQPKGGSDQ